MGKAVGFYTDEKGRRRPITPRKQPTIFFPPKYKYLADMISLKTPKEAEASVEQLIDEFNKTKSNVKKLRIKRATKLAQIRAEVMSKNKRLSPEERKEAKEIAEIYRGGYHYMDARTPD